LCDTAEIEIIARHSTGKTREYDPTLGLTDYLRDRFLPRGNDEHRPHRRLFHAQFARNIEIHEKFVQHTVLDHIEIARRNTESIGIDALRKIPGGRAIEQASAARPAMAALPSRVDLNTVSKMSSCRVVRSSEIRFVSKSTSTPSS